MELALNCMFLQGQETPPSQSSIGLRGFNDPIKLLWLWEAGNRLLKGFNDPGNMEFSCLSNFNG